MSYFRTAALLAGLTALFVGVGYLVGGETGMAVAFALALASNLFAYWNSDRIVLRLHRARPASEADAPGLRAIVAQLAEAAGLPMPRVYLLASEQPNAFATGRGPQHAALAATRGLVRHLSTQEIAGVIAHELAHVRNRDTLIMTITATFAGAISMLATFALFFGRGGRGNPLGLFGVLAVALLAPLAAMLVQMAISRGREYQADRIGAEICGHPLWLAGALEHLGRLAGRIDNPAAQRNPASAHLFIVNPLHGGRQDGLFATHPRLENRIRRLREMAGAAGPRG